MVNECKKKGGKFRKQTNMNRSRMRNRSEMIKINYLLGIPPKLERSDFMAVASIYKRDRGEFSMKGVKFTALMLHQCAAGVAVNL